MKHFLIDLNDQSNFICKLVEAETLTEAVEKCICQETKREIETGVYRALGFVYRYAASIDDRPVIVAASHSFPSREVGKIGIIFAEVGEIRQVKES